MMPEAAWDAYCASAEKPEKVQKVENLSDGW